MLFLTFNLGEERYALDCRQIVEVVPLVALRALPQAPEYIAGVFNYRSGVVPVLDLCRLVRQQSCAAHLSTRIILMDYAGDSSHLLGLMAENITETIDREISTFLPPGVTVADAPYLGEIAAEGNEMIQCIRAEHLLPENVRATLFTAQETVE